MAAMAMTAGARAEAFLERVVAVASGERTLSEQYDFGDNEFVPWHVGAVT